MLDASMYARLPYTLEVVPDRTTDGDPVYTARHPELPGCLAQGATPQEAVLELRDARELYIRSLLDDGITPPMPAAAPPVRGIVWESASGGYATLPTQDDSPRLQLKLG